METEVFTFDFLDNIPMFSIYNETFLDNEQDGFFQIIRKDVKLDIVAILGLLGLILIAFCAEKNEDEFISNLRSATMQDSLLIFYIIFLLSIIFIHGLAFLSVLMFSAFALLFIFIIMYNFRKYKASQI
jgi:hypothetical protein